jgi:hypothetical protein
VYPEPTQSPPPSLHWYSGLATRAAWQAAKPPKTSAIRTVMISVFVQLRTGAAVPPVFISGVYCPSLPVLWGSHAGRGPAPRDRNRILMSKQLLEIVNDRLTEANSMWPRQAFSFAEGEAVHLERRLARAIGSEEVALCVSTAVVNEDRTIDYSAVVLTESFVVAGSMRAAGERADRYESPTGDVHVVRRSAIRALTLHRAEYFGFDSGPGGDYVSFTAAFEDAPPIVVGPRTRGVANDGRTGQLFDALQADLGKH